MPQTNTFSRIKTASRRATKADTNCRIKNRVNFSPFNWIGKSTRVLSERGVTKALGGKRGGSHWRRLKEGGAKLPVYLSADNFKPFISNSLEVALSNPLLYKSKNGGLAYGLPATLLARSPPCFHQSHRTPKSFNANGNAPIYTIDECVFQET
jgi:hypothetical protein